MAFDTSASNLLAEIRASEQLVRPHLDVTEKLFQRYHSSHWGSKGSGDAEGDYLENTYFEYVSMVLPKILYDNPRTRVGTRRPGSQRMVAEAIRHGLDTWIKDTDFRASMIPIAMDMLFGWGVAMVTRTPIPGTKPSESWVLDEEGFKRIEKRPHWPAVTRISPRRFVFDPVALSWEGQRWRGHKVVRVKEDLIAEAKANPELGWDLEVIKSMPTVSSGTRDVREKTGQGPTSVERGEVEFWEIHVFEEQEDDDHGPDDGFNGTLYTVAEGVEGDAKKPTAMREPRAYYGPAGGGYVLFGFYTGHTDSAIPLSPIIPVNALIEELNRQARAEAANAAAYKQLLLSADPQLAQTMTDGKHLHVYSAHVPDLNKNIGQFTVGGMDPRSEQYITIVRDRLNRSIGMDDVHRGSVGAGGTATQAAIADEAATARMDFMKHQFRGAAEWVLWIAAYFMYHDTEVVFPLGAEAAAELGMVEPWFFGGDFKTGSGATFEDLELEIEAYSMERTSEALQQRRSQELMALILNFLPVAPQLSLYTDLTVLLERIGEQANIPNLAEIVNVEAARKIGEMQFQMGMAQQASEVGANSAKAQGGSKSSSAGGQPRLSNNAGPKPQSKPSGGGGLPGNFSGAQAGAKTKAA